MAGLNVGDIVAVTMIGECLGQRVQQTQFYSVITPSINANTLDALQALGADIVADPVSWPNTMLVPAPSNYDWKKLRLQRVHPTRSAFQEVLGLGAGLHVAAATTANVNAVITKRTLVGTRRGVGRMSGTPLAPDQYTAGLLTAGTLSEYNTVGTVLNDVLGGGADATEIEPVLWSRATPTTSLLVTSAAAQDTVRVMRRRTLRVGI